YDFQSMFCCHAGYVENGKKMLKQKLDNLENLCGEVKKLHKEGLSIEEIKEQIFPKKYAVIDVSQGEWDSLHIVSSILANEEQKNNWVSSRQIGLNAKRSAKLV